MRASGYATFFYSIILILGGIKGYMAGSLPSLIVGGASGLTLLNMCIAIFKNKITALYSALVMMFLLDAFFCYRFLYTGKFVPSGMLSFITFAAILVVVFDVRKMPGREAKPI